VLEQQIGSIAALRDFLQHIEGNLARGRYQIPV
jgi:hypothetical protein